MEKKTLFIGGGVLLAGIGLYFYFRKKGGAKPIFNMGTPTTQTGGGGMPTTKEQVYNNIYKKMMAYERTVWGKECNPSECVNGKCPNGKPCKRAMTTQEIIQQNAKVQRFYDCLKNYLDAMTLEDLMAFKVYIFAVIDKDDSLFTDPQMYKKYQDLAIKYPQAYSEHICGEGDGTTPETLTTSTPNTSTETVTPFHSQLGTLASIQERLRMQRGFAGEGDLESVVNKQKFSNPNLFGVPTTVIDY